MERYSELLTQIYNITKTEIDLYITGEVYKKVRPVSSPLEDCVISIINGMTAKFVQNGAVYIKIFYKDILSNNTYFEDTTKSAIFETLLFNLSNKLINQNFIVFDIRSRELYSEPVDKTNEHYYILKLNFKNH